jgi:hypothetical protein
LISVQLLLLLLLLAHRSAAQCYCQLLLMANQNV